MSIPELDDPLTLFHDWLHEAEEKGVGDPTAACLATASIDAIPSARMVLLKDADSRGFVFYTNLESQKGNELKENPSASMCFHWKSLLRQVRINGNLLKVADDVADEYYNSRAYNSRIGAWASKQSTILKNRNDLISSIEEFKKKYKDKDRVPRPKHWSGWNLSPLSIEFWLDGENRIHERLKYDKNENGNWNKSLLNP